MVRSAKKYAQSEPYNRAQSGDMNARREFDIISGAIRDDVEEVSGAVDIDGVSINYQEPETGLSALHKAAARGSTRVLSWMISRLDMDLDIFIQDNRGRTAADLASEIGRDESLEIILPAMYPDELN